MWGIGERQGRGSKVGQSPRWDGQVQGREAGPSLGGPGPSLGEPDPT